MNTKEQVIDVIVRLLEDESARERLHEDDNMPQFIDDSVNFIKLIVELERVFDIEFEDYALDYKKFTSLTKLCDYVDTRRLEINDKE